MLFGGLRIIFVLPKRKLFFLLIEAYMKTKVMKIFAGFFALSISTTVLAAGAGCAIGAACCFGIMPCCL